MKKTFLFLAEGFEEIEAITVVDVLRRGGVGIETVSVSACREVRGAHDVPVLADILLSQVVAEEAGCMVFPGGMPGAKNLSECLPLIHLLQQHFDAGGRIAAICAAPGLVLSKLKTGRKLRLTTYPGFESFFSGAQIVPDDVVVDGLITTAKGPACALKFSLTVLEQLTSGNVSAQVAAGMLL